MQHVMQNAKCKMQSEKVKRKMRKSWKGRCPWCSSGILYVRLILHFAFCILNYGDAQ
jgi:uncharacterized protein (DUF983 family)